MGARSSVILVVVALSLAGCARGDGASSDATHVSVFAASSLSDAFSALGGRFEAASEEVSVTFNFLSSSDLAAQIEQGAPADVFASADEVTMQRIVAAELNATKPRVFAHNELAIVVRAGNPKGIEDLSDLADPDLVVSLCNDDCPAGRYAQQALDAAGVEVVADSLESEVKGVVARVETGEADAGLVYATDVRAAGDSVDGIAIPRRHNVTADYPVVALKGGPPEAQAFVDLVLSAEGERVMQAFGFLPT
jgi:molybdate transport system substrate-binding protein